MIDSIFLLFLVLFSNGLFAGELSCKLVDKPNTSEMKISYTGEEPVAISLKAPGELNFRNIEVDISAVSGSASTEVESFSATPSVNIEIDWDAQFDCFVRWGTQWYFHLNHKANSYTVHFYPFYVKEYVSCRTPRSSAQVHRLSCERL